MSSVQWHDLITPTNPVAALFFGIIISVTLGFLIWFETKEKRATIVGVLVSCGAVGILVLILNLVGFY